MRSLLAAIFIPAMKLYNYEKDPWWELVKEQIPDNELNETREYYDKRYDTVFLISTICASIILFANLLQFLAMWRWSTERKNFIFMSSVKQAKNYDDNLLKRYLSAENIGASTLS